MPKVLTTTARRHEDRLAVAEQVEEILEYYYEEEAEADRFREQESERAEEEFFAEMEAIRQQYIEAEDWEGLYLFDNPAYAKWLERRGEVA